MPLVKCTKGGESGWKWGENNSTCFIGPDAKKKAINQGIKIEGPERFKRIMEGDSDSQAALMELSPLDRLEILRNLPLNPVERMSLSGKSNNANTI